MAKKTVNIGTSVNKGNGDPLRTAFGKINDNFDEIYGAIGTDGTIFNPLSVDSHILPDADNTRDLGSPAKRWRDIFVAPGSLYIGDIKLSNDNGKLVATKVINPGEANEAPDPTDSDAGSEIGSGGNAFDQSLNTADSVTFNSVGATTVNVSQINGTNPGDELVIQANNHNWTFDTNGTLQLPVGGDIVDSNGTSVLGGGAGGGLSISDFGEGFTDSLDDGKITTSKLYNENPNPGLNNQYTLEVTNGGVVVLPDGSIINGATLKTIAGNYAGITAGPASPAGKDEDSWMWVDNNGATIATKYSTDAHTWTFNNSGALTFPQGTTIATADGTDAFIIDGAADKDVQIYTYSGETARGWTFGTDGDLIIPGDIKDSEGNSVLGGGAGDGLTSNDDINITVNSEDSSSYTWNFGQTGILTAPDDIVTGTNGGRFVQDCADGTTSMRWVNVPINDEGEGATQLIRAYSGDPDGEGDSDERAQVTLTWQDEYRSGLTIRAFDRTDGEATVSHDWTFAGDGDLYIPPGKTIRDAMTGDDLLGGSSGAVGTFFVVVNEDGTVSKSTDGVTWTAGADQGASINRVATNGVTVAMIQGNQLSWTTFAGLEASTWVSGSSSIDDSIGEATIEWNQIDYAGGYFVAVGSYTPTGSSFEQGVYGYSTDGRSWTFETVDQTVVEFFANDPVDSDWQFSDVDYNGAGWMFSVSDTEGGGANGGGVYITDLTATVTSARCFSMNITYRAAWNGSAWYMEGDESIAGVNTNLDPRNGTFDGPIDPWATAIQDLGISAGSTNELAGGNGYIAAGDSDGHVAWSDDNGQTWQIVTPIPYTRTISAITQASPAVVTSSGGSGANGEKVVISGSSVSGYNGTFYWKSADSSLYTDQALTTPFDTSGLAPFTGTATLTWSNGQFIDAMDFINGYFYIGNDDEQIARTTDFVSWTIVDDQDASNFDFWNDIAGFVGTASSDIGDIVVEVDSEYTKLTLANKDFTLETTRTGGQDADINLTAADDIFIEANGDDIALSAADQVRINTGDFNGDPGEYSTWTFNNDGALTFPDGSIQTTAYTGQTTGGATVSNVWVQTFETTTPATDTVQIVSSVEYDAAGNIIALFTHSTEVGDSTNSRYYSVGKYTTTGTRIWTVKFADDFYTDGWGLAVDLASGFVYIAGQTGSEDSQINATLTKISGANGSVEWSKKYDFGFSSYSAVVDVASDGNPVMAGAANDENSTYVATTKIDEADGSIIWSKALDGQGQQDAYGMAVGPNGEVVAVGWMSQLGDSTDTDNHMVVVKYNSAGAIQWQRAVLFDEGYDSNGADADIDSEGNIYVTGEYETDSVGGPFDQLLNIVKFNSSGVKQWSRRLGGNCGAFASSVVVGPDDHLYLSATTFTGTNPNDTDIHLVVAKYEFDGTVAWQRLLDYTEGYSLGAGNVAFGYGSGASNLAVKQDYVAVGLAFSSDFSGDPNDVHAAIAQVSASGDLFTVGSWDFKAASFIGSLDTAASDITVSNADKDDIDNITNIDTVTVTLEEDSSNFLVGTLYSTAEEDDTVGFTILADGTLQATAGVVDSTVLTDSLTNGRPDFLIITPRSPDRDTLDTHYGFDSTGMWFTGDNEETLILQPAYPIHTRDAFPADAKVVVEFDVNKGDFQEDHGVCVYPANGVPHWAWDPHPSRIAAMVDGDSEEDEYEPVLYGFTGDSSGPGVTDQDVSRARFTYDPLAELTTFELLDVDGIVTSRCQTPGRLARGQDYMIGFDADWDEAGVGDKSYFTNLTITTSVSAKTTELTVSGEIKLPNTVRGFVNMQGPWSNNEDDTEFQTVTTHDGFAYMGGECDWTESNSRIDKYSLTTGELVWSRVIGAGRGALFDISWTGGVFTIDAFANTGQGYRVGDVLYVSGSDFTGGSEFANRATITVQSVGDQSNIVTATIAGTAPSGTGTAIAIGEQFGDAQGFPTSIKYDTVTDTVVVLILQTTYGNTTDNFVDQVGVIRINPVSGDVVSHVTLTDEGDIYGYDVAIHPTTGATAVVGAKYNEYKQFGALVMAVEGNGYFDILKSELDEEHYPGNQIPSDPVESFLISGTGITGTESVDSVNYYESISGTTRQGSNAEFNITDNLNGTYSVGITASVNANYRVGHKIKILGSLLGGVDVTNDATITVTEITTGNITGATVTGLAAGSTPTPFNNVTGTNIDVGTGLTLNITVNSVTGSRTADVNLGGSNYVANDVVVIAGTQFAGGTTPTNNVEVTVVSVGGSGNVVSAVTAGTTPTNIVRIRVDGVDFTVVDGAWTLSQNLDSEAFVWTPTWNKAIGSGTYDRFQSVVYSKDGASIYAVGDGYYEVDYKQSLVVKFATSDGAIGFSKYLNSDTENAYATGVATIGASDIVVSGYERVGAPTNRDRQFVARLSDSGQVVWKKFYSDGNWGNSIDYNSDIQVDSDDNIYVTIQLRDDNTSDDFSDGFTVTKLDRDGNLLWSRCVSSNYSSYLGDTFGNRWSSLHNDQLVVAGYTYETADDYYNGLWASFPTDGFVYSGGEDEFVQMGAFRFGRGRIKLEGRTFDVGGSFTPSVQPPNITAVTNFRNYATRTPSDSFPQHLHKMVDPKHGGLVFGDGSRQITAADRIPQIKADDDYWITANDSGKHIYFKNNSGTVYIPGWWRVNLPVGFTFTIVNCTGSDCSVSLEGWPGEIGTILGAGRNISTPDWGIPDSGSGSMVTLILLEAGHEYGNSTDGPVWMISGPGDIYDND